MLRKVLLGLITLIYCFSYFESVAAETTRPNIIVILADDISPKEYRLYGGGIVSPTLEKMAMNGLYFKTAWATPRCIPTRATLLTGKYPFRTQVYENQLYPRGSDGKIKPIGERFSNTLGSLMTENGYRTAMIGKIQTGTVQSLGFEHWCIVDNEKTVFDMSTSLNRVDGQVVSLPEVHSTDSLFDYLKDFTAEASKEPWFVYMPLNLPHWVRNPDNPSKWEPPIVPELNDEWQKTGRMVKGDFKACVRYIDYKIGKFLEHLESIDALDNSVIFYLGDNGSNNYGKSNPQSEKGPHVPFVVYAPGILNAKGACDVLVDITDIIPTCVELADGVLPEDDYFDGLSFAPLLSNQAFEGRNWIFSQWYGCRWLRTKHWLIDGLGHFYYCGDERNEWVPTAYKDVTFSDNETVITARRHLEKVLKKLPAPDFENSELKGQWQKFWLSNKKYVHPYQPPYLENNEE